MGSNNVQAFTDENFEAEVLKSDKPVLVDFTATWCGPCKMLSPIVEKLADEMAGKIKVGKLDIDNARSTSARYSVRSVPTVMVFKGGERVAQHVGLTSRENLIKMIQGD